MSARTLLAFKPVFDEVALLPKGFGLARLDPDHEVLAIDCFAHQD